MKYCPGLSQNLPTSYHIQLDSLTLIVVVLEKTYSDEKTFDWYSNFGCGLEHSSPGITFFKDLDVFALEWASNPQISPDGQLVVYNRNGMDIMKDRRQSQLWIMNIDGTNHQKLTVFDKSEGGASWSPSGDRLAFTTSSDKGSEFMFIGLNQAVWLGLPPWKDPHEV